MVSRGDSPRGGATSVIHDLASTPLRCGDDVRVEVGAAHLSSRCDCGSPLLPTT